MDQSSAPMLDGIAAYHRDGRYGFTPPAHRQGNGIDPRVTAVLGADSFRSDLLASGGMDDRRSRNNYLTRAEQLMADAVGARSAFFSTCGSSLSVKAAMMAVAGHSDSGLLVARDSHKSIVAGLVFSGVRPRWIGPRWDAEHHISHPPSPEQVRQAWEENPDAAGALIVSPTPYGTCADISAIADICHDRGKPLIVDEAWGAHLPFHPDLPTWAMDAGADICVVSVHKMGAGFEQGSVYHLQGDLVDDRYVAQCADLLMTTSPNVLLYAAMDGWRRQMVEQGHDLLGNALQLADTVRHEVDAIEGLTVLEDELLGTEASTDLDRLQVLIDVSDRGVSGYQCADWLRENHHIDLGMSDHRRILATLSFADTEKTAGRLLTALRDLASTIASFEKPPQIQLPDPNDLTLESVLLPRDAFFADTELVEAQSAPGRIAAEQLTPYPPGIPAVVPGERLSDGVVDYLTSGIEAGMNIPDATDPKMQQFRVVR
ncbi:PLP-dependent transferase [Rhodococcus fascians]|nr:PLP-dependent transferase [Rhodococcus fascians]MBY4235512.1 PLP-dependent transferase [Rhodococcus fascians]MBY4251204.1 PLP-dependent transferase [Rhodococcus fascians]MBY4266859.1 PLP-dependent transferase [Rhodococcus fascians]MBY4272478.1 PLP-dependent transferase [Rhodococcus fascians]